MKKAKKKTVKKTPKKTSAKTSVKASAKKTSAKKTSSKSSIVKTSKKIVDQMLVKISPALQEKIDHLIVTLESSKAQKVGDLSLLASKILLRAQEVSRSLRTKKK